ncbi:lipopolysaccharide biosynthesis protein [Aquipuribacter hungaricus]|uniref:Lipopolysaccharide biosynthesis protein n=1 Tax=Aquipuribacter hungaricus TaxID=545624 RepID=A0ABV7WHL7_9MICO
MTAAGGERQRALRNVGWSAVQRWTVRLAGVVTFVVLGRLLEPGEIGLATLAVAVVGLLAVVADLGMTTFLVQADEADRRTTSTVFWTALGLGCTGAGLLALVAGPVAAALDEPDAAPVLRALAGGLVLTSLTVVPAALMLRAMRFRAMAGRGVGAALVSAAVGIGLAVAGAGVWALVAQNLVQNAVSLVWFWVAARWWPSATFSRPALREAWRFGSALLGINLVQALRDRADGVLIGSLGGLDLLGYWAVATRLLGLLHEVTMSVMDHVALPLFVRLRDDLPRFERGYETAGALSTAALAPLVAVLAAVSPVVVPGLFGQQWEPSVLPAQLLAVAYGVGAVGYFNRSALLAFRRSGTAWAVAVGSLVLHVVVLLVAAPAGLPVLAAALGAAQVLTVVGSAVVLRRTVGVGLRAYDRSVRALLCAAVSVGPMLLVTGTVPGWGGAVLAGTVGLGIYAGLLWLVDRSLVREGVSDIRGILRRRATAVPATAR